MIDSLTQKKFILCSKRGKMDQVLDTRVSVTSYLFMLLYTENIVICPLYRHYIILESMDKADFEGSTRFSYNNIE